MTRDIPVDTVRNLAGEGFSDRQIGDRFGVSDRTIWRLRHKHNIPPGVPRGGNERVLEPAEVARLAAQGISDRDIAERFGVASSAVFACRKRNGIPTTRTSTRVLDDHPDADRIRAIHAAFSRIAPPVTSLTYDESRQALCAQTDPEAFFPRKGGSSVAAKKVCAKCPLTRREDGGNGRCLEVALANREPYGVWGGLSERARRKLTRESA